MRLSKSIDMESPARVPPIYRADYRDAEMQERKQRDPREYCVMSKDFVDDGIRNAHEMNSVRVEWTKNAHGGFNMAQVEGSELSCEAAGRLSRHFSLEGRQTIFNTKKNILVGNVCLYGAIIGTCFSCKAGAERFAVTSS
jgi:hypothetical protein